MKTKILAVFPSSYQAHVFRDVLENEGIKSFMKNETLSSVLNYIPGFQNEILVFEEDYEKALELLKNGFPELVE